MAHGSPVSLTAVLIGLDSAEFEAISGWPFADPFVKRLLQEDIFNSHRLQYFADDWAMHVGQSNIASAVAKGESFVIDGCSVDGPDTAENQATYPQNPAQEEGLGFPGFLPFLFASFDPVVPLCLGAICPIRSFVWHFG